MKKCELCNNKVARILCQSDQASLCWDCDSKVHSANFLVGKHTRTLLCHSCQSPTPWMGSGPKLSPTVSVCEACVDGNPDPVNRTREDDEVDEEDVDDDDDDVDQEEEDDDADDDSENQVVPLSPPPSSASTSTSSSSQEPLSRRDNSSFGFSRATITDQSDRFSYNSIERAESKNGSQNRTSWTTWRY